MTIDDLHQAYASKRNAIRARLAEFEETYKRGDHAIFEELVFCIFTAGASARMGLRCVDAVRPVLLTGNQQAIEASIQGLHLYPAARAAYVIHTRDYLANLCGLRMRSLIESFPDPYERRRFFAENKDIKGIGYKEASHFLRNIGFRGYAILDKHILRSLHEFRVLQSPAPPRTPKQYLEYEALMKQWANEIGIDFDELDLLLWSNRTGEILK
ncbi:MAG: 8-oxoguanine DNA glycosylase [Armatimonadota bacterium]